MPNRTAETELTDEHRARVLEAIEKAKESGGVNISGRHLKRIRGRLEVANKAESQEGASQEQERPPSGN